ncbi:Nsp1-like C-terminal region-domain-containing protein [Calycina marina]|uniref:Nucleoporin NSP1 n=1 Tax=Calycina marina TaxID=1763456 RepID=A0A9P8CG32_9HELO|nr:Nsp1-like C-terminal region-domain-containing protein [Calycina marina]
MDEIINRWTSDLVKYQKEFQEQANKVAAWDRLMVDNSEKIQKLYNNTFEAEKASTEVERQLAAVESQQAELIGWLDRYEEDVDQMMGQQQLGLGENLQGPDQERERTYKLAEKLTERLDDMGKNITNMVEAINDTSASLSKSNSKADDPLTKIVRVLNSHLQQLQWIDTNAAMLKQKVTAAQQQGQGLNGDNAQDDADAFYRSYIGRK